MFSEYGKTSYGDTGQAKLTGQGYTDAGIRSEGDTTMFGVCDSKSLEVILKIIEFILDDNYINNLYLVNDKHVNMILAIINNPKPNIEINLPDSLNIQKSYDKLKISRTKNDHKQYKIPLEKENYLPNGKRILIVDEVKGNSNYCTKLNSKELLMPLYIRTTGEPFCSTKFL